jgi:meiotic recombination protein SPO11
MDLDLLYGFIGDHESGTSPQLLSNLHDRRKLTPEQIAEDPALEDGDSNGLNDEAAYPTQRGVVITKIEDIFESIADCILDEGKELVIPLKTRPRNITVANKDDPTKINSSASAESRKITFPSKSPREAWKFSEWRGFDLEQWLMRKLHFFEYWSFLMKH